MQKSTSPQDSEGGERQEIVMLLDYPGLANLLSRLRVWLFRATIVQGVLLIIVILVVLILSSLVSSPSIERCASTRSEALWML